MSAENMRAIINLVNGKKILTEGMLFSRSSPTLGQAKKLNIFEILNPVFVEDNKLNATPARAQKFKELYNKFAPTAKKYLQIISENSNRVLSPEQAEQLAYYWEEDPFHYDMWSQDEWNAEYGDDDGEQKEEFYDEYFRGAQELFLNQINSLKKVLSELKVL